MLKAVVKNVELRVELSLRQLSGFKAAFADNHRTTEPACDQQRLVPEIRHIAVRIHYSCAPRFPPITAREHVKLDAAVPQHLTEHNDERCFAGSARRNASHADCRPILRRLDDVMASERHQTTANESNVGQSV